ncbi:Transglycosylase SLT family protein [Roseomonas mucosa]|uniref:Transglycosylase SLT family protein n=1 Tax=Roseomonas mucosa TaxID=207340 RepID=A0A4Y1MVR7_9PROT|nr:transglycosylase SLT domain-containing protein [Roseomonas mucosa]AWV21623.1 Transglycosylase SLT family protein [Roseomonas mucosa]MDT8278580.1 transglycosylase SLT domain-containing protein [Roseomonas mucosa]MDT8355337.1 transglycosylase SLT domain-containing protein [Roseomonas mucosa]UZO95905.1 Transglycosylase SLT family protein [Roseomonas mucosa]
MARRALSLLPLLLLLSACGPPAYTSRFVWDGRRGYDGNGDYGYDTAAAGASRAEASSYLSHAARSYRAPGPEGDPWGPHVREAASRFAIPERWIREVMRQESAGNPTATSRVGAMGLMQVMPATYDILRSRYGLGSDPYEPRSNIMAGAAYIREMSDQFGAPAFLAAYNAGPQRLSDYLAGNSELPGETINYLARIAPRLGTEVAMTGPLAGFATGSGTAYAYNDPANRAYDGGGLVTASAPTGSYTGMGGASQAGRAPAGTRLASARRPATGAYATPGYASAPPGPAAADPANRAYEGGGLVTGGGAYAYDDPANRAFDGGGLVTASTPTGNRTGEEGSSPVIPAAYAVRESAYASPPPALYPNVPTESRGSLPSWTGTAQAAEAPPVQRPAAAPPGTLALPARYGGGMGGGGGWGIQVGAFPDPAISRAALSVARSRTGGLLASARDSITPVSHNGTLYRARLTGLSADGAGSACQRLQGSGMPCFTVPPGS